MYNQQAGYRVAIDGLTELRLVVAKGFWASSDHEESSEPCEACLAWDGESFYFMAGYDAGAYPHCASCVVTMLDTNETLRDTARSMLRQLEESVAESEA